MKLFTRDARSTIARRSVRRPQFGLAELSINNTRVGEVYVRDLSEDGACLVQANPEHITPDLVPDAVTIEIPFAHVRVEGTVCWRNKNAFGVRFATPVKLPSYLGPSHARHLGWIRKTDVA